MTWEEMVFVPGLEPGHNSVLKPLTVPDCCLRGFSENPAPISNNCLFATFRTCIDLNHFKNKKNKKLAFLLHIGSNQYVCHYCHPKRGTQIYRSDRTNTQPMTLTQAARHVASDDCGFREKKRDTETGNVFIFEFDSTGRLLVNEQFVVRGGRFHYRQFDLMAPTIQKKRNTSSSSSSSSSAAAEDGSSSQNAPSDNSDVGHMEAVNLLSSNKYTEKQIGYLFISVLIEQQSDLMKLIVQGIRNDLTSRNPVHVNLALQCISNMGSREMVEAFCTDLTKLLVSGETIDFVKQSAALCILKLFRNSPESFQPGEYASRIVHLLNDSDMGVVTSAASLIEALSKKWPEEYKGAVPLAISRLSRIVTATYTDLQDYIYYFVPAPWLCVKLLRLLQNYPPPDDPSNKARLLECLEGILNKAQDAPKSKKVQHSNAKNAVLFEAIALIIHMDSEPQLLVRACNQLGTFLSHRETNLRYLALESMCLLATSEFSHDAVKKHQDTIINSLKTKRDVSVRQRAVDLLYAMCDRSNANQIVAEMYAYLETADYSIREEMVLKVAILVEKNATDYTWYVDVILKLIRVAGDYVSEEVWYRVIQIAVNREYVQIYAAKTVFEALQRPACHENMVKVGGYILGEFGNFIAGDERSTAKIQFELLHSKFHLCSTTTQCLLLATYIKFCNLFPEIKPLVQQVFQTDHNLRNPDAELQQRSIEYLQYSTHKTGNGDFMALPNEADHSIGRAWNQTLNPNEILVEAFNITVLRKDLVTLCGLHWLNDTTIDFFLQLICDRNSRNRHLPKTHAFGTFFYTNLSTKGYASVKRWTRKIDLFSYEIILIPVHLEAHWCMAVIDMVEKKVQLYDSLYDGNTEVLPALKKYITDESADKKKVAFDFSQWEFHQMTDLPRQQNGSDCGVFSCQFGECASRRQPPTFTQLDMPYFRKRMAYEILEKKLCESPSGDEVHDFEAIRSNIREQAARCMDCGVPFCQSHSGCPLGNIIPKWNDFVFEKNWRQAFEQLLQTNNFPEFTGRVCPAPCEGACTLRIGSPAVTIKSIECAIIDYAFMQGWMKPCKPAFNTGKRIAIIGSGPSGLGAAAQLIKVGHTVVVYERKNRIGGLLRYVIPTMKLDKFVVDRRVTLLEQEGVRFLTNTEIGKHVPADFLLKENDAIIVCTGSTAARDLPVEGRDAKGICFAMEYLEKSQRRRAGDDVSWEGLDPANKKVIILGGGDTATDCIATSNRLGCKTVGAFEILPQPGPERKPENPWPEWPLIFRVDYGHEEAKEKTGSDPRTYSVSTKRFLTTTNSAGIKVLTGLEIVDVEWEKDEKGAWKLVEKTESLRTIECDLCILAMGFVGPEKSVIEQLNLKTDPRLNILTPKDKYDSDVAKVFAAGDCRRGQSLVVWAIHEGRQAARQVDEYLMGKTTLAGPGGIVTAPIQHKNAL